MEVTIEAIRPIPSIALLPIALIALGFGYRMEIVDRRLCLRLAAADPDAAPRCAASSRG